MKRKKNHYTQHSNEEVSLHYKNGNSALCYLKLNTLLIHFKIIFWDSFSFSILNVMSWHKTRWLCRYSNFQTVTNKRWFVFFTFYTLQICLQTSPFLPRDPRSEERVEVGYRPAQSVLNRVGQQQSKWQRTVRQQRRNIYDKRTMLNWFSNLADLFVPKSLSGPGHWDLYHQLHILKMWKSKDCT